jgi:hypothetical protein
VVKNSGISSGWCEGDNVKGMDSSLHWNDRGNLQDRW